MLGMTMTMTFAGPTATFSTTGGLAADLLAKGEMIPWEGTFVVEGIRSGDRRGIADNAITWDDADLPMPLMAMFENPVGGDGHDGAMLAGRIDAVERRDGGKVWGRGFIDPMSPGGPMLVNALDKQLMRGCSVDLDSIQYQDKMTESGPFRLITEGRLRGLTATPFQAFTEATISLSVDSAETADGAIDDTAIALAASAGATIRASIWTPVDSVESLVASGGRSIPIDPPAAWFAKTDLGGITPLTITQDGRIFGHVAAWGTCHISFSNRCQTVPRSATNYAAFRTGTVLTAEGTQVRTGPLVMDTVHPDLRWKASDAQAFYSDTGCAVADIVPYEDKYGIAVFGAIRPDVTPAQLRALRASDVSPDWRSINGHRLECCAMLAVNNSGFKLPQTIVASAGVVIEAGETCAAVDDHDEVFALVASAGSMAAASTFAEVECPPCAEEAALAAAVDEPAPRDRDQIIANLAARFGPAPARTFKAAGACCTPADGAPKKRMKVKRTTY